MRHGLSARMPGADGQAGPTGLEFGSSDRLPGVYPLRNPM